MSMKAKSLRRNARQLGFTLIELLIAIAIVGILATLAVPSYVNYLRRGAAEEGTAALADGRVALEQFYLDNKSYKGAGSPCPADTSKFTMKCEPDVDKYKITATGKGNMTSFAYTIDQSGLRTTAGPWGSGNCWIVKKGDSC
jgi:type IV pilus assembly protein PilE